MKEKNKNFAEEEKKERREGKEESEKGGEGREGREKEKEEYYAQLAMLGKLKEVSEKLKQEIERGKKAGEKFKEAILKQFPFISAIGLAVPLTFKVIEENMEESEIAKLTEEKKRSKEGLWHTFIIVPEENAKELPRLVNEAIRISAEIKPKLWFHFFTPTELWEICFDGKYDFIEAIAMAIPIHDSGILGALRVATIHKMMVLGKFEKYVVSYVLAGSIVRGQATQTSDVDVFIVIDDTDVKRLSRFELKERLRSIIWGYAIEANERANAKNKLSPQVYILTEFWEAVKEAHPVIFTFIRDGVPLYDRGAFMPWKLLLKMGKIKPSPEAIEMFMSLGEKVTENVRKKLGGLITEDIYWGVITPSQATLMLYGIAPPTPRETVKIMKEIFVDKEKLLEKKYIDILERIVEIYKKYEHEEKIEIKGKELDFLLEQVDAYIARLKRLAAELEERARAKAIEELSASLEALLKRIYGEKSMAEWAELIEGDLMKKGVVSKFCVDAFKRFVKLVEERAKEEKREKGKKKEAKEVREEAEREKGEKEKKEKISAKDFELLRKDILELIRELKDYVERKEIFEKLKRVIRLKYKVNDKIVEGELVLGKDIFLIPNVLEARVEKFDHSKGAFVDSSLDELRARADEAVKEMRLDSRIIKELEKRFKYLEFLF